MSGGSHQNGQWNIAQEFDSLNLLLARIIQIKSFGNVRMTVAAPFTQIYERLCIIRCPCRQSRAEFRAHIERIGIYQRYPYDLSRISAKYTLENSAECD